MATDAIVTTNPSSSHSPSQSQGSSTNPSRPLSPPPPPAEQPLKEEPGEAGGGEEDAVMNTGVSDKKTDLHDGFQNFTEEEILKYQKYEADYARRLKAKYFSGKDIYGGDLFDLTVTIANETIKASRWSPTRSYEDPKQSFINEDKVPASGAETNSSALTGNTTPQKSS